MKGETHCQKHQNPDFENGYIVDAAIQSAMFTKEVS